MKTGPCRKCGADDWYRYEGQRRCRPCQQARARRYEAEHGTDRRRASLTNKLRRRYGLSAEDFGARLIAQAGLCGICSRALSGTHDPHVDHNHATGVVRALLCGPCNRGLGYFGEDPARLRQAVAYLAEHAE